MALSGLMSFALLWPAAPPAWAPNLQRGDEFTYTGTVAEAVDRPGNRFRRTHEIEVRVFVLERRETWVDAAVLTLLRRVDDAAVAKAVSAVTGTGRDRAPSPPATRLDLVRVHEDGTTHLIDPPGPAPLRFAPSTPARTLPVVPLDTFAPFEFGMFPPRPRPGAESSWSVASADKARPAEAWSTTGFDFVNAERCTRLRLVQRSADWEKPHGGQTAWQREDWVWVSAQVGVARRVHRLIQQRDGLSEAPAVRVEVKYELKDETRLNSRIYDRYRREIEVAYAAAAELAPLLRDAARLGPRPFAARLAILDAHLDEDDSGTPYREAVLTARRQLDAARRGDTPLMPVLPKTPTLPIAQPQPPAVRGVRVGQPAPDFTAGGFRLADGQGTPVVLVFFMPGSATADLSLAIADALRRRYGPRLAVVPLAVFADTAAGIRDRDRLKLSVPVYDGSVAGRVYDVETFPRFLVIDGGRKVRWMFAGVGAETGFLVRSQVDALLTPSHGTITPFDKDYPASTAVPSSLPRR